LKRWKTGNGYMIGRINSSFLTTGFLSLFVFGDIWSGRRDGMSRRDFEK
jgi:hypothetical protein